MRLIITLALATATLAVAQNDQYIAMRRFIPQIADGGYWKTTITILNGSTSGCFGSVNFFAETGRPLSLAVRQGNSSATLSTVSFAVMSKEVIDVETLGTSPVTTQGYATMVPDRGCGGGVSVVATYKQNVPGALPLAVGITGGYPMVPAYGFMFDNIGGMATGIAIVNADSISGQFLLNFYASGALVASKVLNLGPLQHMTVASAQYPELANLRGYAELKRIDVPGGKNFYPYLSATVLRFDPSGSIAAMPMMGIY